MDDILQDAARSAIETERAQTADDLDAAQRRKKGSGGQEMSVAFLRDPVTERAATDLDRYQVLVKNWLTIFTLVDHLRRTDEAGQAAYNVMSQRSSVAAASSSSPPKTGQKRRR